MDKQGVVSYSQLHAVSDLLRQGEEKYRQTVNKLEKLTSVTSHAKTILTNIHLNGKMHGY